MIFRYIGTHQFSKPIVMLTDPEIIKQVTIKDFDCFQDHIIEFDKEMDPLFGNILISLTGTK